MNDPPQTMNVRGTPKIKSVFRVSRFAFREPLRHAQCIAQRSTLNAQCSMLNAQCLIFKNQLAF